MQHIIQQLFQVTSLSDVPREKIEHLVEEYPAYGVARYLLSQKLQAEKEERFREETYKTNLYFSNPYWLHWQLKNQPAAPAQARTLPPIETSFSPGMAETAFTPEAFEASLADEQPETEATSFVDHSATESVSSEPVFFVTEPASAEPASFVTEPASTEPASFATEPASTEPDSLASEQGATAHDEPSVTDSHSPEIHTADAPQGSAADQLLASIAQLRRSHQEHETSSASAGHSDSSAKSVDQDSDAPSFSIAAMALEQAEYVAEPGVGQELDAAEQIRPYHEDENTHGTGLEASHDTEAEISHPSGAEAETKEDTETEHNEESVTEANEEREAEANKEREAESSELTKTDYTEEAKTEHTETKQHEEAETEQHEGAVTGHHEKSEADHALAVEGVHEITGWTEGPALGTGETEAEATASVAAWAETSPAETTEEEDLDDDLAPEQDEAIDASEYDKLIASIKNPSSQAHEPAEPVHTAAPATVEGHTDPTAPQFPSDLVSSQEPAAITAQAAQPEGALIPIEPYHTIDYFASQGIKLTLDEIPNDKLGRQLKSFTDWLKTMRRLPQKQQQSVPDIAAEHQVRASAAHSIEGREILTETMAEVLVKQGMREKATEVYRKLSLLNPDKNSYFAKKIEQLKID